MYVFNIYRLSRKQVLTALQVSLGRGHMCRACN